MSLLLGPHLRKILRRADGHRRRLSLDVAGRRTPRHHRPQRRRQDDADPPALRRLASDSGTVLFAGDDITRLPMADRVRRGLARSFQITSILPAFTRAGERRAGRAGALRLALPLLRARRRAKTGLNARRWTALAASASTTARAARRRQPSPRREAPAGARHRARHRAPAAAARRAAGRHRPRGGRPPGRAAARLKGRITIVLIEHDMDAVFALADRMSACWSTAASSPPARRRRCAPTPEVRAAYLGEEEAA